MTNKDMPGKNTKTVSLVLGSGGARGLAHIGVIHWLEAYPADHFIEIARNACGTLEFDRATEMIELGYRRAEDLLA
jgi:predicted acylesterase/phospholipase RssA